MDRFEKKALQEILGMRVLSPSQRSLVEFAVNKYPDALVGGGCWLLDYDDVAQCLDIAQEKVRLTDQARQSRLALEHDALFMIFSTYSVRNGMFQFSLLPELGQTVKLKAAIFRKMESRQALPCISRKVG